MHTRQPKMIKHKTMLGLGLLALAGSLTLTRTIPAHAVTKAPAQNTSLAVLAARLNTDEAKLTTLQNTVKSQAATIQILRRSGAALSAHDATTTTNATTTTYGPFTVTGSDVYLNGYNLHIQNGSGKTSSANGKGNLIIGYNEVRTNITHTGSHNLVVGQYQTYTSFGGIVSGYNNSITGQWASAIGGDANVASGTCSSVTGGYKNTASGNYASVLGSQSITASAQFGLEPVSTSIASLQTQVTNQNKITSLFKLSNGVGTNTELTLTGKNLHIVDGSGYTDDGVSENGATTLTGLGNLIVGYNETRASGGGSGDVRTGSHNIITGQYNNFNLFGGIVGGYVNNMYSSYGFIVGESNTVSDFCSSVSGGENNTASNSGASVSGGDNNTASGSFSCVSGGYNNMASATNSSVSGGFYCTASGYYSSVSGGDNNAASATNSSVSGGFYCTASGANSSVSGGYQRSVSGSYGWAAGSQASTNYSGNFASP